MNLMKELERLRELHSELLRQARILLALLEQENEEAFEDALSKRVTLFNELNGLHKRLAPVFSQWEQERGGLSAAKEEHARKTLDQIRRLGRQVLDIDRRAEELLKSRRANLVGVLGRLKESKRVRRAYGGGSRSWWGPDRLSRIG